MNYQLLSKYRKEIFGFSIISILILHFCDNLAEAASVGLIEKNYLVNLYHSTIGSSGVEIFLFLSGGGLYYSWSNKHELFDFYRKRILRIMIVYIPFGMVGWFICDCILEKCNLIRAIADFFLITFWTEGRTLAWFIALILPLYMLFPVFYSIIYADKEGKKYNRNGCVSLLFGMLIVLFAYSIFLPVSFKLIEIGIMRIPIFILGVMVGKKTKEDTNIKGLHLIILVVISTILRASCIIIQYPVYLWRLIQSLWSLAIITVICFIFWKLKLSFISRILSFFGNITLELYLSHVFIRKIFKLTNHPPYMIINYLLIIIFSVVISYSHSNLCKFISEGIFKKGTREKNIKI